MKWFLFLVAASAWGGQSAVLSGLRDSWHSVDQGECGIRWSATSYYDSSVAVGRS